MAQPHRASEALSDAFIASRQARGGFAKVPHMVTADPELSDEGFRLLAALESWAWNKPDCRPSNRDIAIRAGWFTKSGKPAVAKVKRVLRDLEGENGRRAYVRRVIVSGGGMHDRQKIELLRPLGVVVEPKVVEEGSLKIDRGGSETAPFKEAVEKNLPSRESECESTPARKRTFSDREFIGRYVEWLPDSVGDDRDEYCRLFALACKRILDDDYEYFGSWINLAKDIADRNTEGPLFLEMLDKTLEHVALGHVHNPGAFLRSMLEKREREAAFAELDDHSRTDPEDFVRTYNTTPLPPYKGGCKDWE